MSPNRQASFDMEPVDHRAAATEALQICPHTEQIKNKSMRAQIVFLCNLNKRIIPKAHTKSQRTQKANHANTSLLQPLQVPYSITRMRKRAYANNASAVIGHGHESAGTCQRRSARQIVI